jgi:hypothetical protein
MVSLPYGRNYGNYDDEKYKSGGDCLENDSTNKSDR